MNERAVRAIERWGLLAGVTGMVANLLLIALYALAVPGMQEYDWTGPANDVIGGIVSTLALIPVALALRQLLNGGTLLNLATGLVVFALLTIAALSLLLVTRVIPFEVQGPGAGAASVLLFVWVALVGRAGTGGGLPRGLARWAMTMGIAALAGALFVGVSLLLPWESAAQYAVGGVGLVLAVPAFLAYPIWLIVLSNTLRGHAAARTRAAS